MKLKNNIFTTLLLAIGFILHQITPGILGGMKFDFLVAFMIVSLILNHRFQNAILTGLLAGILSAMATTFPLGQIPNIIDKLLTSIILAIILNLLSKLNINLNTILVALIGGIGTFISGMTFLTSASFISGLPAPLLSLIITIVIPTSLLNTIGTVFIFKIVKLSLRASGVDI
jgi:hypothetical protein